jgi:hypothetical protein
MYESLFEMKTILWTAKGSKRPDLKTKATDPLNMLKFHQI